MNRRGFLAVLGLAPLGLAVQKLDKLVQNPDTCDHPSDMRSNLVYDGWRQFKGDSDWYRIERYTCLKCGQRRVLQNNEMFIRGWRSYKHTYTVTLPPGATMRLRFKTDA